METIMILGAGIYQVPLIRRAKARGFRTAVVSIRGDYPGFALADRPLYIDTTDREEVLAAARRENICAVATTGTDVAVPALGLVCDALGLPGVSLEAALKATDKIRMKEAFRAGGVQTSAFRAVSGPEEALAAAEEIGYPVMIKIPDRSGSRGITKAETPEALREAWDFAREATEAPRLLTEGFVDGREFGVDALIQHGRFRGIFPHEKLVYRSARTGIPAGHLCPDGFSDSVREKIGDQMRKIQAALGLDDCAVNVDAILTPEGNVSIIEAAARCGGTGIPEALGGALGTDYYDRILDLALGVEIPELAWKSGCAAASRLLWSQRSGRLAAVEYRAEGTKIRNGDFRGKTTEVSLDVRPGARVTAFANGTHRIGQAVFRGETREAVRRMVDEFTAGCSVETAE